MTASTEDLRHHLFTQMARAYRPRTCAVHPYVGRGITADGGGLVDPDGLRLAVARLTARDYSEERDAELVEVLSLHLSATAFLR